MFGVVMHVQTAAANERSMYLDAVWMRSQGEGPLIHTVGGSAITKEFCCPVAWLAVYDHLRPYG